MTGLTRREFKKLWKLAEPHFADTTTRATPRQRKRAASVDGSDGSIDGNAALFSDKVAFFVTLYWLRCYHTEDVLAVQLGVEQLNLRQHLWRGVAALASALIPVYLPGPPLYDDNKGNRGWWLDLELEQAQYIGTEPRFKWLRDNDVALALAPRKLSMWLIGGFAACALVLAAIGMYGVVAYGVTQRTPELGVRKALGATDETIAALVLRESLMLTGIGVVVGCAGAWAATRLIRAQLFETPAVDPLSYAATIGTLTLVALLATYLPARRAMRLDPIVALRVE